MFLKNIQIKLGDELNLLKNKHNTTPPRGSQLMSSSEGTNGLIASDPWLIDQINLQFTKSVG